MLSLIQYLEITTFSPICVYVRVWLGGLVCLCVFVCVCVCACVCVCVCTS